MSLWNWLKALFYKSPFGRSAHRAAEERIRIEAQLRAEYLRQLEVAAAAAARRTALLTELQMRFTSSFITADAYYQAECTVHVSAVEYEELKVDYLRKWFRANLPKDDVLGKPSVQPSAEQLSAIGAVSENIQVVARAGSGKTATIVNRAFFLHKHCDIPLDQMLLMAFNRKAAREMADRLEKLMGMRPPHVMTFHALAYAIASPEGALLYDDQDGEDQAQSRFFQQVLDEHLSEDGFVGRV